jgi:hypothetical protein
MWFVITGSAITKSFTKVKKETKEEAILTYHVVHPAAAGDGDGLTILAVDRLAEIRQASVHA